MRSEVAALGESADLQNLVLEVTPRCNNACLHCYNYWSHDRDVQGRVNPLSRGEIFSLFSDPCVQGHGAQVALSGGEPLLRRDLTEITCDLFGLGLRPVVITNASLLNARILRALPRGTIFEVTLFSADRDLHDRIAGRRCFDRVVGNLLLVERFRHRFVLACVLTRLNAPDIKRTIKLGLALGAEAVLLNRVNLTRRTLPLADTLVPPAPVLRDSLAEVNDLAAALDISIAVSVPVPPCVADAREYGQLHFGWCPRGGQGAYYTIGWDGRVRPCNHSSIVLGDIRRTPLLDAVDEAKARPLWARMPKECEACSHPLRDLCRGGCPAAAYECYGTSARIDPFVDLANRV